MFNVRDLGEARVFVDYEIERDRAEHTLKLTQRRYAMNVVEKFGLEISNPRVIPMSANANLRNAYLVYYKHWTAMPLLTCLVSVRPIAIHRANCYQAPPSALVRMEVLVVSC